ncbi:methyltransferase domain-containing protein [Streptomyces sp. NPDC087917]|uniref:class I SAM-dependent methyltransferase n=1 Tax=Streptomyces sp. NPDC087917 TaxID=3155060 RepID=UPI00342F1D5C
MPLVVIRHAPAPGPDPLDPAPGGPYSPDGVGFPDPRFPDPLDVFGSAGSEVRRCDPWSGDPVPPGLIGIEGLVLTGDTPEALPLLREALAAEVPVLALGDAAALLARAADDGTRIGTRGPEGTDPLLGDGAGPVGGAGETGPAGGAEAVGALALRVGGSAWGLPVPLGDIGAAGLLGRFAELVAGRAEHTATRTFFTPRAEAWEERFAYQTPAYEAAVARMRLAPGQTALDLGCGSGRAMPALRERVGASGTVLGIDLTPAMLTAAARVGREGPGRLLLADCTRLPLTSGTVHGIFAAGLLDHLPQPRTALAEWARVCATGGELLVFHPSGRAERAARHGRPLSPDDPLAAPNLAPALEATGWHLAEYEDAPSHFVCRAHRLPA